MLLKFNASTHIFLYLSFSFSLILYPKVSKVVLAFYYIFMPCYYFMIVLSCTEKKQNCVRYTRKYIKVRYHLSLAS